MLLLVFFWSLVDDSRDKVLKSAPLRQLLPMVNLNPPIERSGVFVFDEASRFDSRSVGGARRAYLCQPSSHVSLVSARRFRLVMWLLFILPHGLWE